MKIIINSIKENPASLLRRAGYVFQYKKDGQMSFVKKLSTSGYPRFHAYVQIIGAELEINLHLDQKKETYGQATRHHGEYEDSEVVKKEADYLKRILFS
jgi:hypothetical protein